MAGNFNLSNNGFGFGNPKPSSMRRVDVQPQQPQVQPQPVEQAPKGKNPFDVDAIFSFKKPDVVYDTVMKSGEMLGFLKAQKVAGQFLDLTKPEYQVGRRLNFEA